MNRLASLARSSIRRLPHDHIIRRVLRASWSRSVTIAQQLRRERPKGLDEWTRHWRRRGAINDRIAATGLNHPGGIPFTFEEMVSVRRPWVDLLCIEPGSDVLEVGCGTGLVLDMLVPKARRVVGVDISPELLAQYSGSAETLVADACHLPFSPESFDRILLGGVSHYFPSKIYFEQFVRLALGLLRSGGQLVIADLLLKREVGSQYLWHTRKEIEALMQSLACDYELSGPSDADRRFGIMRYALSIRRPDGLQL